ncbi:hypothetical protein [Nocardia sp. NPDC057668]|uniref:hypothetical protein n=1 Tax=Nocardia sp. NPDC057668 TaxID=3346202 RepID=UPI0036702627
MTVMPAIVGAIATASGDTPGSLPTNGGALSWLRVTDSRGVRLTDYELVIDHGGVLNPGDTALAVVIDLEFIGYIVMVSFAIWLIGYIFSFQWLAYFSDPLRDLGDALAEHVGTPLLLAVAVTIGGLIVAMFVMTGHYAKAVTQIATMIVVAVFPIFMINPVADILAPDGLLSQGRDVGMAVAADISGDRNPDSASLVASVQERLADGFGRYPAQVWNFGHIVDDSPACGSAWSQGMSSNDSDRLRDGLRACGDLSAYAATTDPSLEQVGAGVLLLIAAAVILFFALYLSTLVVRAVLDSIYHAVMVFFGFAAGGFIYGPPQSMLVRNLLDGVITALRMAAYSILLGVYVLFLGEILSQAREQVMPVLVLAAIATAVGVLQLRRMSAGIDKGNQWIANWVASALQSGTTAVSGGHSSSGMGVARAGSSLSSWGPLPLLAAATVVNSSPITEQLLRRRGALSPNSRVKNLGELNNWSTWAALGPDWANTYYDRRQVIRAADRAVQTRQHFSVPGAQLAGRLDLPSAAGLGGANTVRGGAAAIHGMLYDGGGDIGKAWAALIGAQFTDEAIMQDAVAARAYVQQHHEDEPRVHKQLAYAVAAMRGYQEFGTPARLAELEMSILRYRDSFDDIVPTTTHQQRVIDDYFAGPSTTKLDAIGAISRGTAGEINGLGYTPRDAQTIMAAIGTEHANRVVNALDDMLSLTPAQLSTDIGERQFAELREELVMSMESDLWSSGIRRSTVNSAPPSLDELDR